MGKSGWHQLQYLWRKRGATLSAPPVAPHGRRGALWGVSSPSVAELYPPRHAPQPPYCHLAATRGLAGLYLIMGALAEGPRWGSHIKGVQALISFPLLIILGATLIPTSAPPASEKGKIGTLFSTAAGCSALHSTLSDRCNRLGACLGFPSSASAPTALDHVPRGRECPLGRCHVRLTLAASWGSRIR